MVAVALLLAAAGVAALSVGSSDDLASGTPAGKGFVCGDAYLTWSTTNGHLKGVIQGPKVSGPVHSGQADVTFHGTQSGEDISMVTAGSRTVGKARLSGSTLFLEPENFRCVLKSQEEWSKSAAKVASQNERTGLDRLAEANLVNALTSAKALYVQTSQYPLTASLVAQLAQQEPSLHFTAGPASGQSQISVSVAPGGQGLIMAARSNNGGRCWYASDNPQQTSTGGSLPPPGVSYNVSTRGSPQSSCSAANLVRLVGNWNRNSFPQS
jgi:hypothetical protein